MPAVPKPVRRRKTAPAGVSPGTRAAVISRDGDACQWCGVGGVTAGPYSLQHRRPRGAGGSTRPDTNRPQNLVLMCGTGTTGCHGFIESHREVGRARGFFVYQDWDPLVAPIVDWSGMSWQLLEDGTRHPEPPF